MPHFKKQKAIHPKLLKLNEKILSANLIQEVFEVYDEATLEKLSGLQHDNLRVIAELLSIDIGARGRLIHMKGEPADVQIALHLFQQLNKLAAKGREFSSKEMSQAVAILQDHPTTNLYELFTDVIFRSKNGRLIHAKGPGQKAYVQMLQQHDMVFGIGPAGTGKTYLAMTVAVSDLLAKRVSRIVLTRPAVEAGEKLGFLPGNKEEKVLPYLRPLYDAMFDLLGREQAEEHVTNGVIEVAPLAFMRGRTLNDAFIILDEAQNTTREQMKMFLTRLGFGSKMVITGDVTQIDLPSQVQSGLIEAVQILKNVTDIAVCQLTDRDVVRHHLVQSVVRAYKAAEEQ